MCKVSESPDCSLALLIDSCTSRTLPDASSRRPLPTPSAVCARRFSVPTSSSKVASTVAALPLSSATSTITDMRRCASYKEMYQSPVSLETNGENVDSELNA